MKEFMARYGIQSLEIPSRNIHEVDKSKLSPQQIAWLKDRYEKLAGYGYQINSRSGVLEGYVSK